MIVFNTLKQAQHYVKWWNKKHSYYRPGYDYESYKMIIINKRVLINHSGDGCGCGCENYLFNHNTVKGRIKSL